MLHVACRCLRPAGRLVRPITIGVRRLLGVCPVTHPLPSFTEARTLPPRDSATIPLTTWGCRRTSLLGIVQRLAFTICSSWRLLIRRVRLPRIPGPTLAMGGKQALLSRPSLDRMPMRGSWTHPLQTFLSTGAWCLALHRPPHPAATAVPPTSCPRLPGRLAPSLPRPSYRRGQSAPGRRSICMGWC